MSDSILSQLFSETQCKHFQTSWPEKSISERGKLSRLPAFFSHPLLQSIEKLTESYRGGVFAADRQSSDEMTAVIESGAAQAVQQDLTVYMDDLTLLISEANDFLRQLENELCMPSGSTRIGVFVSPPGNGAPCHFDVEEVISIQLLGTKQFNIAPVEQIAYPYGMQYSPSTIPFDDLYPQLSKGAPDYTDQCFTTIQMQPGSVLYMPRGTWHNTIADEPSLAVSIILKPPTHLEKLLGQLTTTLLQDENWRRPSSGQSREKNATEKLYAYLPKVIDDLIKREGDLQAPTKVIIMKSRFIRTPSVEVTISNQQSHCDICIAARLDTGEVHTAKLARPVHSAEVIQWLSDRKEPFYAEQLTQQFPALPWDILVQILEGAEQSMLIRFLWFDPL